MQPSRRQVLATIGSGAALGLGGCVVYGGDGDSDDADGANAEDTEESRPLDLKIGESSDDDETGNTNGSAEAPTFPTEGPLEARLVGPDADIAMFDRSSIEVGEVSRGQGYYYVPVTLSEERSDAFLEEVQDLDLEENYDEYEIVLTVDGEEIRRSGITPGLAQEWNSGEWNRQFIIQSPTEAEAERLREALV